MADAAAIAAAVAERLNITDATSVEPAASAALVYVGTHTGVDMATDVDDLVTQGLILLTERVYLDTGVPGGNVDAAADPTFSGLYVPADLASHLHHYWDHITTTPPVY